MALDDKLKMEMVPEYSMGTAPIYRSTKRDLFRHQPYVRYHYD